MARNSVENRVTTTMTMIDRATPQAAAIATKIEQEGAKVATTEDKIAQSSAKVAAAKAKRLSPSKQVALAMQLEAARGNELQTKLALLAQQEAKLAQEMRALVRANQPIPPAMLKQAAAAKKASGELTKQTAAVTKSGDAAETAASGNKLANMSLGMMAAAAAAAGAAVLRLTHGTAAAGDEIGKTSRKLGISAETLQAYRKAADDSGSSSADLDKAIRALGKRSAEASGGNKKLSKAFSDLGVDVHDAEGNLRDVEELLPEVADGLVQLSSDGERTATAMTVMGLGGNELLPMLAGGAEGLQGMTDKARELGGVIDNETIQASEDYMQAIGDLKFAMAGLVNAMGDNLIPALTDAAKWWTSLIKKTSAWTRANDEAEDSVLSTAASEA